MPPGEQRSLRWSAKSVEDLTAIWSYLAEDASPTVADRQLEAIVAGSERLRDWPHLGRERWDLRRGLRSIAASPYLIFYRISDTSVEVVRVLHGQRDLDAIFKDNP
jgi:toxin ParE1/3/4